MAAKRTEPLVLYIEDDRFWRKRAKRFLTRHRLEVETVAGAEEGLARLDQLGNPPQNVVILLDLHLKRGKMQGAEMLAQLAQKWPSSPPPVIVLSIEDDFSTILPLTRQYMHGEPRVIYDYQNKRYGFSDTPDSVLDSYERLAHAITLVHLEHTQGSQLPLPPFLIGISQEIREVFRQVRMYAAALGQGAQLPILILGGTGTGKEVVARLIHFLSPQREHPFVAVNCAAIPENLLESELFGSIKGAFTGATTREGLFEAAGRGTLFLDEIGEMPPSLQAKLLRVLQEGRVRRLGDSNDREINAQVVAATNQRIHEMVRLNRFRKDLYYRLGMLSVRLPRLEGRTADIELLVNAFVLKFAGLAPGVDDVDIRAVRETLAAQSYPGNVRELEGIVMKSLILASASQAQRLTAAHVNWALEDRIETSADAGSVLEHAAASMAKLADQVLDGILSGKRNTASLPEIETEFGRLSLAFQLTLALERRLKRQGKKRKGPTDKDARAWFGYSGASSYRRWVAAARKHFPEINTLIDKS